MFEVRSRRNILNVVTACGVGAVVLSGCGSASTPEWNALPKVNCKAESTDKWGKSPTNLIVSAIAKTLGTSNMRITEGKLGIASCDREVTKAEIESGIGADIQNMDIDGISNHCLIVGYKSPEVGLDGLPPDSPDVRVICPQKS